MALWEIAGVALGGSYWLHYLTGLVPGVVLLLILAGSLERRRLLLTVGVVLATVGNAGVWAYRVVDPPQTREDARVAAYLREHSAPTDSLLVGFGHPNVYVDAEMRGQYPYMWSLPTRVNDPELRQAKRVLSGSECAALGGGARGHAGLLGPSRCRGTAARRGELRRSTVPSAGGMSGNDGRPRRAVRLG